MARHEDEVMPYRELQSLVVALRARLIALEADVYFLKRDLGLIKVQRPGPPREQGKLL